jgi:ribosomal protein L11 methyltransferase
MKANVTWWLLSIPVHEDTRDLISSFLFTAGVAGVVDQGDHLDAYFQSEHEQRQQEVIAYLQDLQERGWPAEPEKVTSQAIEDQDWNREWKKNYHPVRIGKRLLIRPSWEPVPSDAPECVIEIDPEMAFGTGTHATTQLCLRLLEDHLHPGQTVLDVGTGTGILAIAAAKLGASRVSAFDVDEVAVETAIKNAQVNLVEQNISFSVDTMDSYQVPKQPFDWLVANINRDQIVKMLPTMTRKCRYPMMIILSGILVEEENLVKEVLYNYNLELCEIASQQEWLACLVKKSS